MAKAKHARQKDDLSLPKASVQAELRDAIEKKLVYSLGKTNASATDRDWYQATALAIRDRIVDIWVQQKDGAKREQKKRVYYFSIEFLLGRLLFDNLFNLQLVEVTRVGFERPRR
jgi:starch phosphorylase